MLFPRLGLKALALLGVLPDGGSPPENQALPVTAPTQTSEEQPEKKAVQAASEPAPTGPAGPRSVRKSPFLGAVTGNPRAVV